jgi:hypothetical protein
MLRPCADGLGAACADAYLHTSLAGTTPVPAVVDGARELAKSGTNPSFAAAATALLQWGEPPERVFAEACRSTIQQVRTDPAQGAREVDALERAALGVPCLDEARSILRWHRIETGAREIGAALAVAGVAAGLFLAGRRSYRSVRAAREAHAEDRSAIEGTGRVRARVGSAAFASALERALDDGARALASAGEEASQAAASLGTLAPGDRAEIASRFRAAATEVLLTGGASSFALRRGGDALYALVLAGEPHPRVVEGALGTSWPEHVERVRTALCPAGRLIAVVLFADPELEQARLLIGSEGTGRVLPSALLSGRDVTRFGAEVHHDLQRLELGDTAAAAA